MNKFKITPSSPFSFEEYSEGYIFEPLYRLNPTTFTNSFSLVQDSETWFINAKYSKEEIEATDEPITINLIYYRQIKNKSYELLDNPPELIKSLAKNRVINFLGLNDDLHKFYNFIGEFDELSKFKKLIPGFRLSGALAIEWLPILAYLSTNTTVNMYHTFLQNFLSAWGVHNGNKKVVPPAFPPVTNILPVKDEEYRKTKIGYRAKYLPVLVDQLQTFTLPKDVTTVNKLDLLKQLKKLTGIGDYSARCIILYGLKDFSMPFVDSYVKFLMKEYFGIEKDITNPSLLKILNEKFHPYQGLLIDWLTAVHSVANKLPNTKIFSLKD